MGNNKIIKLINLGNRQMENSKGKSMQHIAQSGKNRKVRNHRNVPDMQVSTCISDSNGG